MKHLHWKTKLWLELQGEGSGSGGSKTYKSYDKRGKLIMEIPMEAHQLLDAAWTIINQANGIIEKGKNVIWDE